jgi:hypothetical protein
LYENAIEREVSVFGTEKSTVPRKVIKLHAIDRGLINGTRIIYYGKVYKNSLKQFVFCRIFTLALSK